MDFKKTALNLTVNKRRPNCEGCYLFEDKKCSYKCDAGQCIPFADVEEIEVLRGDLKTETEQCNYLSNGQCFLSQATTFKKDGAIYYIGDDGKVTASKEDGEKCRWDHECIGHRCNFGSCMT